MNVFPWTISWRCGRQNSVRSSHGSLHWGCYCCWRVYGVSCSDASPRSTVYHQYDMIVANPFFLGIFGLARQVCLKAEFTAVTVTAFFFLSDVYSRRWWCCVWRSRLPTNYGRTSSPFFLFSKSRCVSTTLIKVEKGERTFKRDGIFVATRIATNDDKFYSLVDATHVLYDCCCRSAYYNATYHRYFALRTRANYFN